ncbi:HAMP domain-containing histidine kinase [Fulvivirga sp. M361]|uniref:sensor histidine kinase n=1 Tax=Fulvivirga sp. M361 TaxID=2594266 RepID=UPI00117A1034|nr:HAMP domain-containing sensor histidine kinase [Fulvivirga sp. M361]TRX60485.1 HAMP domain-containing histidine kinase [Fulvivirga sp. M361]
MAIDIVVQNDDYMLAYTTPLTSTNQSSHDPSDDIHLLAHDIKSPLSRVNALLQLAKLKGLDPELLNIIDMALQSSDDLGKKVDQILNSAMDKTTAPYEKIDFHAMLKDIKVSLSALDSFDRTKFIININQEDDYQGDPIVLYSVLHNLIENAIKYRRTEVSMNIIIVSVHATGNVLTLTVSDNGLGIRKEDLPNIFNRSFQANFSNSNNSHGFGLYLIKRNVGKLGGQVDVESEEGEGTTFTVKLPFLLC